MAASKERYRVVVVGAGVVGLSTALHLLEKFGGKLQVTIVSDQFSPDTTADKAGTLIMPLDWNSHDAATSSQSGEQKTIQQWAEVTYHRFHSIYRSEANADIQLVLRPGYFFRYSTAPDPSWKDLVFGFRHVDPKSEEAYAVNAPPDCTDIWAFQTYVLNCTNYLQWLMSLFQQHGGLVEKRRVSSFDELESYDIIINCTGLGSHELLGDNAVQPARGQHVIVDAPWIAHFAVNNRDYTSGNMVYVQPRATSVTLGGTIHKNNWSEAVDPATEQRIVADCKKLIPSLAKAKVVDRWACLRPLREKIRFDKDASTNGTPLIHCYGHGGQGGMLSWGCALDISDLVQQAISEQATITRAKL